MVSKLTPEVEKQAALVEQQATDIVSTLTSAFPGTEIATEAELEQASQALTGITKNLNEWEQTRKQIVGPANAFVRHINDLWKMRTEPVRAEEVRIRRMMGDFRAKEARRRQEEYEAALKESQEFFANGSPIPEVVAPIPEDVTRKVETENGSVQFTTVWKWAVEDEAQIPREYFALDTVKLNKVVKAGLRNIPGIRVYSEQVPAVRSR